MARSTRPADGVFAERSRKLRTARAWAGLTYPQLAERLKALGYQRGYSAANLQLMETGGAQIQPQHIPPLAEACGVSPAFFAVDFAALDGVSDHDRVEALAAELRTVQLQLATIEEALRTSGGEELRRALAGTKA